MGFDIQLIDRFVSAGEDARNALERRPEPFHKRSAGAVTRSRAAAIGRCSKGIGLEFVETVEDAEFLAVVGHDSPQRNVSDYEAELRAGVVRRLPMICANPDLVRLSPQGLIEAAGRARAALRSTRRGRCSITANRIRRSTARASRRSAVPRTKCSRSAIRWSTTCSAPRAWGLRSALIPGGVHGPELGVAWGELPAPETWRAFAAKAAAMPDYLLGAFNW